ncbi:MAG: SDR family NAD(P)-dependent oxidoreductase [Alphaproteobacteria bacterium]|nr:SDR family NAD(P)-dependent oxidoreductase [Alphaproteobacteria bacterium]
MKHPIAIVGMGCRFAGSPDVGAYWRLTVEGRDAFGPVPADRWPHEQFFDTNPRSTDKSYAPNGAFIDDIRSFPALALGIPPRRVEVMDPQQRHALLVAREAIQDAGYRIGEIPERTGVYMGVTASEWRTLLGGRVVAQLMASGTLGEAPDDLSVLSKAIQNVVPSRPFSAPGALANMVAAAVAQELDLHGPAYTVDAACASGMVALENAVQALRAGTVDCAIAGGVYLALSPENHIAFSRIGAISRSGVCRPFDSRADGFVQGDGAGAVVLKRLEDAQRDGDRIYAVVHGIAANNDGHGDGPMAPLKSGQMDAIRRAWSDAGSVGNVGYVETHGTGTSVGDQTELEGLVEALGDRATRVALGSSKANIGHTMSAAGIAGLVRTALAIHHRTLPPMAGFEASKPELGLEASAFFVPTAAERWEDDVVAGVSSFGFGGTNVHAVLAAAPGAPVEVAVQDELLALSAASPDDLRALAASTADALDAGASVASVARALAARTPLAHRAALVASDRQAASAQLRAFADGGANDLRTGHVEEPAKLGLLFPGQGAQRVGMLADARQRFPIVGSTLDELDAALDLELPIAHLLYPTLRSEPVDPATADAQITDTAACQPVMYACSVALARLLRQVGVQPVAATGHSLGEFNAAVEGGVMSAVDGARFVTARGRAMASVEGDTGAMAAVMAPREVVADLLVDGVVIANVNHPRQLVISGTTDGVAAVVARATEAGVSAKPLVVSHAFHSPIFDRIDATPWLEGLELHDPTLVVASGIDGRPYADASAARQVFLRHTRSPVDFVGALEQLVEAGADVLLQVGAGGPLASFARGAVGGRVKGIQTLGGRKDDDGGASILDGLGWLWCQGVDLDVRPITAAATVVSLPAERLPTEPYWAVKERAQKALSLKTTEAAPVARVESAPAAPVAPAAPEPSADEDARKVFAVVAKVSAYPIDALKASMRLVDDLGFDSLMVGDMATGLADAFPGIGGIPQELLINGPTVQDLVDFVKTAGTAGEVDDDAPLTAYRPVWIDAPRIGRSGRDTRRAVALVVGDLDPVASALVAAGVECTSDRDEPAELVVCDETDPGALIALLAHQLQRGAEPDLLVVPGSADHAAVAGVVRAYAAERDVVSKVLSGDALPHVVDEWLDCDRTPDVHYAGGNRRIRGFVVAPEVHERPLGEGDVVVISGGTRGIGLALAQRLKARGCVPVLLGRSAAAVEGMECLAVDVTDAEALRAALAGRDVAAVVHAAGVLADGPLESVEPDAGALARRVKIDGFRNLIDACPNARVVMGIGSWAGRFGNRHQAHYAAANAGMAALAEASDRVVVGEYGPWSTSEMVRTIPAPIQATMRSEGVDFVGDEAGMDALLADLLRGSGIRTQGRDLPLTTRQVRRSVRLSTSTHPWLLDHAIEGTPVLALAGATDLMVEATGLVPPFEVDDLRLYQGVAVREPVTLQIRVRGDRVELRQGDRGVLSYRARIRAFADELAIPEAPVGGDAPSLSLEAFYDGGTFHGPLLQGITAIEGVGAGFVRGRVRTGRPVDWEPGTTRARFAVDPLALDSAMQLSGYVALTRFERAGTPVGIGRLVQLAPLPEGELLAEVHFGEREDDRFAGTIVLRRPDGRPVLVAERTVAELRRIASDDFDFEVKREWIDPSTWPALKDLDMRLEMAKASGIDNPYFSVHEGTARDTTVVEGPRAHQLQQLQLPRALR